MVKAPDEPMARLVHVDQREPHHGSLVELEAPSPVGSQELVEAPFPLGRRVPAPVVPLKGQFDAPVHDLEWLVELLPVEGCAERGMPARGLLPGPLEGADVERSREQDRELLEVDGRLGIAQGVVEHSLLGGESS